MAGPLRPFRCRYCGHRMRLSGGRCSACYQPRAFYQHGGVWAMLALPGAALLVWLLVSGGG